MPKTRLGKWAGIFLGILIVSLFILIIFVNVLSFRRGSALTVLPGITAMASGIAAFVTGLISLLKFKDRSSVVVLAVVFGSLALLIALMEVVKGIVYALK